MATYNKYTAAVEPLLEGINSGSDVWRVALAITVNAGDTVFTPATSDLVTGNGYTAGGNVATTSSSAQSGGVFKLVLNSPATWTATGALTFRYVILWNSTTSTPVGYWDYGSNVVMATGDTFTATLSAANGVFTVT